MIIDILPDKKETRIKIFTFDRSRDCSLSFVYDGKYYPMKHQQFLREANHLHSQGCEIIRIIFNPSDYSQYLNWMPRKVWKNQSVRPIRTGEDVNLVQDQVIIEYLSAVRRDVIAKN